MAGIYNQVDDKNFKLPDMGEYYDQDLVEEFLKNVDKNNIKDAAFYIEEPFNTKLGYYPEHEVFVIKAIPQLAKYDDDSKIGAENEECNHIDGDTMNFFIDSIEDGGSPFNIRGKSYNSFKEYAKSKSNPKEFLSNTFKLRHVGINAKEVSHYTLSPYDPNVNKTKFMTIKEAKTNGALYDKTTIRNDNEKVEFLYINQNKNKLCEIKEKYTRYPFDKGNINNEAIFNNLYLKNSMYKEEKGSTKKVGFMKVVYTDDQEESQIKDNINYGTMAKDIMIDLLNNYEDMRIIIDGKQLQNAGLADGPYKETYNLSSIEDFTNYIKDIWARLFGEDVYKWLGFNAFGQDKYRRWLGAIYLKIKIDGKEESAWINVAKYLISKLGDNIDLVSGLTPIDQDRGNTLSPIFNIWSYDKNRIEYADAFFEFSKNKLDDRREIQRQITGYDYAVYKDYTVIIGDCLFMVPPTSIRVINQTQSERIQLLRSKGTMTKQKPHNDRMIQLTLYFNNETCVNGYPYETTLPNGEKITYYMNGLRSLLAMFKVTPFLPIENEYINNTLNIEAVSLVDVNIQTMPSYPKCLAVSLTLQQFKYRVYMNELPIPNPELGEDYDKNMFAASINYKIMRHYYQQLIINGEALGSLNTLSDEYVHKTLGNRTSLIPMKFIDQSIKFYKLDNNWLDTLLSIKEAAAKRPINQIAPISEEVESWANKTGIALTYILEVIGEMYFPANPTSRGNDEARELINKLAKDFSGNQNCPNFQSIFYDKEDDTNKLCIEFNLGNLSTGEFNNLIKAVYKELDLKQDNYACFKSGRLYIPITGEKRVLDSSSQEWRYSGKNKIDKSSNGYQVALFFAFRSGGLSPIGDIDNGDWDDFVTNANEEAMEELKDNAVDLESILSAKFIEYPLDLIVNQISISMGNIFANTKLKSVEGYAPQYCGGQDTIIEFVFQTRDENAINALNILQEMAAEDLIKYRKILSCWPIRIDCEMTKLCGINEVLIESLDMATVPGQPGLYSIQCRMLSVDRTMRNKEALKKLDAINNAGAKNPSGISSLVYRTYFELNDVLAQAEVYPDLELPTIEELEKTGYKFIRYLLNKRKRIYPDPDFYFVYGYTYSTQMLKKLIVDYFDKADGQQSEMQLSTFDYTDDSSGQDVIVALSGDPSTILEYKYKNQELYEKYIEDNSNNNDTISKAKAEANKKIDLAKKAINDTNLAYKQFTKYENEILTNTPLYWNICENLKCIVGDMNYKNTEESEVTKSLETVTNDIIKMIDDFLKEPIAAGEWPKYRAYETFFGALSGDIGMFYKTEFKDKNSIWNQIFDKLKINKHKPKKDFVIGLFQAASMALSANTEYSKEGDQLAYHPKAFVRNSGTKEIIQGEYEEFIPYSLIIDKDTKETFLAKSTEQAINEGVTFGAFQIRKYDREYLRDFYNNELLYEEFDFLDPYYNKTLHKSLCGNELSKEELSTHISNLVESPLYTVYAFNRVVLVWMKKLLEEQLYISFFDLRRNEFINQYNEIYKNLSADNVWAKPGTYMGYNYTPAENTGNKYQKLYSSSEFTTPTSEEKQEINDAVGTITNYAKDIIEILEAYEKELLLGKIFLPLMCAAINGDKYIYEDMKSKDIGSLEVKTQSCAKDFYVGDKIETGERTFRKLIKALCYKPIGIAKNFSQLAGSKPTKLEDALIERSEKLWLMASQDPSLWVVHSFYDMIVNDKRGRMARAFPTYYLMLIDEGREIGYWKLNDNFYNTSAISEIEITKSRKIPADTARVVLTNMYKTFTNEDEDIKTDYYRNIRDVFKNIFSPHTQFLEEQSQRENQLNVNRIKLRPGARIQIRMGYSGDASELPILFNGVIAEVGAGELIEIIAQGDGHELTNPNAFSVASTDDIANVKNEKDVFLIKWFKNFWNEGATPKQIITNMFTTKSSFFKAIINMLTDGRLWNDNMFGVVNFGEIDYKDIHKNGEVMQNIYEAEGGFPWTKLPEPGSTAEKHNASEPPHFTIDLNGKSVWDVLNICASSSLDFLVSTATFGARSTVFFGRPHYYYAYDYTIKDDGKIMERRKPFQQYHLIDSYSDIIANNIIANGADIKTCAVPVYIGPSKVKGTSTVEKKLEPLWIDFDIYPEYQKTVTVDTQMVWKGPKYGVLGINAYINYNSDNGGNKIAWRMGAKSLKDSVKDMYKGEVISIGDPTIKPYDRVYIHDIYENMNGSFEVEAVVHRMSTETGYTTSTFADCISTVDNRYEQIGGMWSNKIFAEVLAAKGAMWAMNKMFDTTTKPMLQFIAKAVSKGTYSSIKTINSASRFLTQEDIIRYTKLKEWNDAFYKTIGLDEIDVVFWTMMDSMNKWVDIIGTTDAKDIKNTSDMLALLNRSVKTVDKTDLEKMASTLESRVKDNKVKSQYVNDINEAIELLNKNAKTTNGNTTNTFKTVIDSAITKAKNSNDLTEEMKVAVSNLEKYQKLKDISTEDAKDIMKNINKISTKIDDLYDDAKVLKSVLKYGDDVKDVMEVTSKVMKSKNVIKGIVTASKFSTGPIGAIIWFVAETILEYVVMKNIYTWIEMKMASYNVLQIYPLKKDGVPMIAGIDGHRGLVIGSPSYNQSGVIDNFINWAFKDRGYGIIKSLLFSDNMIAIAETYKKDNKLGEFNDNQQVATDTITGMLKGIAEHQVGNYSIYKSLIMSKRIEDLDSVNAKFTFTKIKLDVKEYQDLACNQIILNQLVPITIENDALEPYFENKFFKVIHDMRKANEETISDIKRIGPISFDTKACGEVKAYGINIGNEDNPIIDIPFLRPDAFHILYKIIDTIATENGVLNPGELPKSTVYFTSGTTVNSNKWSSTGYSFKFFISNYKDIETLLGKIVKDLSIKENAISSIVKYKDRGAGVFEVFISPRDEYTKKS